MTDGALSIEQAAATDGGAPFVVTDGQTHCFAAIADLVRGARQHLLSHGVRTAQPTPIAVEARNDLPALVQLLALIDLGVPALLLHPRWSPAERARVMEAPDDLRVFPPGELKPLPWTDQGPKDDPAGGSTLAIVYSSGSSGQPRGIALSRNAFLVSAAASAENLGWQPDDRWLLSLPLAHVGGLSVLIRCLVARRCLVLPPEPGPDQANDLHAVLERFSVSLCSVVPTQLHRLLQQQRPCPASLRAVLLGGAPASTALLARALQYNYPVLTTYGLTECCSQVTTQAYATRRQIDSGVGLPLRGTDLKIVDGRVAVRSASLFSGYFPAAPAPLTEDGFFVTADAGRLDAAGHLYVLGRTDDVIVSGGENVHPEEVEACLLEHPRIDSCCVFGLPDEEFGECVSAAIVGDCDAAALKEHLALRLAGFKRPKRVVWVQSLPTTASGKISRQNAKRQYGAACPLLT